MDASSYQEIRELFDNYIRMYSTRDDLLTAWFSDDFSGITGSGDYLVKDREAWVAVTRQDFAQVKDPINIELKDLSIQLLAETIAVTSSTFVIHLPIEEHILSKKIARLVLIFRREDAGWKISHSSISVSFGVADEGEIYPLKDLQDRNRHLEALVAERTGQLSEANEKLKRVNEELAREVEKQKAAELANARLLLRQRAVLDNLPMMAWLKNTEGRLEMINEQYARSAGRTVEECLGKTDFDLFPGDMAADYVADDREVCASGRTKHVEERIATPAGTRWHSTFKTPLFDELGRVVGTTGIAEDITERKQAEELLSYATSLTSAALESTPDGILVVNRNGEIARWNRKFVELWEVPEELLVTDVKDPVLPYIASRMVKPDEFLAKVHELYARPEASGQDQLALADGRHFDRYTQPLKIGDEIVGRFWSYRDVTDLKKHQLERLRIEKLESLGLLAGGIAHDFNNILTGVMGNVSIALLFLDATHKSFKPLEEAEKASLRATELAHQLLTFARGGEPVRKVVSLPNIVNESVELGLSGSNVRGVVDIPDTIHAIDADEGQLCQVLHNIVINASQAMPGGGTLAVTARNERLVDGNALGLAPGNYVRLTVADQGCGMTEEVMGKIFDPYFTTKSGGNGLGLASVYSIITRHGGHVGVASTLGRGTTFTIHLPSIGETYQAHAAESAAQEGGDQHGGGAVLVMDDEAMIRDLAALMLVELGYRVTTCAEGAEAVRLYGEALRAGTTFAAVIMDLTIPGGMGGKEAAERILAMDADANLIVSSGYSNDPIMADYPAYGFRAAVAKPYTIKSLGEKLTSLGSVKGPLSPGGPLHV
ncbi:hypothetical protein GMSM_24570 [Geomonas sp. Red276]